MFFCEDCRVKKNWMDGLQQQDKCEVCGASGMCHNVPAIILIPEAERTVEQKLILKTMTDAYRDKAEKIVITGLDGRVNNRMTEMVREMFVNRKSGVDWYATFIARMTAQECYQEQERAKRDRR